MKTVNEDGSKVIVNQKIKNSLATARDVSILILLLSVCLYSKRIGDIAAQVRDQSAELDRISAKQEKIVDSIKNTIAAIRETNEAKLVTLADVLYECEASNSEATCVVTNPHEYAATTCFVGTVTRKGSSMSISTIIGCTGRMEPRSTVKVSTPFHQARASYLCPREGLASLPDWDKCEFAVAAPSAGNTK